MALFCVDGCAQGLRRIASLHPFMFVARSFRAHSSRKRQIARNVAASHSAQA
jgi:hypothetical protein